MWHCRGEIRTEGCHMVCGYGVHKPWGCENDKTLFCCIARENSPINFGLIAYKHGMQAAECLFPEIPGWALLYLLPSEVGYMAGSSHGLQPAKTTVWCQGYGHVKGGKCAHYTQTPFLTSRVWSAARALSISVLPPFGSGSCSKRLSTAFSLSHWYTRLPRI